MSRPSAKSKGNTTIIKRSAKKGVTASSGGAWKVAFADFTLAMMALFMVLWIVNSVTQEEREEIVALLNGYSIFDGNFFSPIQSFGQFQNKNMLMNFNQPPQHLSMYAVDNEDDEDSGVAKATDPDDVEDATRDRDELNGVLGRSKFEMEELARVILKITQHYDAQSNLNMEIVPQGLRILIQDDKSREMFQRGSATLTPFFNQLLSELAPVFEQIDNPIIITGHTDATQYRNSGNYNNWNLSGERALAARRVLERGGLTATKVLQVNAMSDQMLLTPEDPTGAQNRRIEIMVLTKTAANDLYQFFGRKNKNNLVVTPALLTSSKAKGDEVIAPTVVTEKPIKSDAVVIQKQKVRSVEDNQANTQVKEQVKPTSSTIMVNQNTVEAVASNNQDMKAIQQTGAATGKVANDNKVDS